MEKMSNHTKTVIVETLLGNYNWLETLLANIGLESLVVYSRAQKFGGVVSVRPVSEAGHEEFPLLGGGIDYD